MPTEKYQSWRNEAIKKFLEPKIDPHATDHSTIVGNPMHSRKALAYDLALGVCDIKDVDMGTFRKIADWRRMGTLNDDNPHARFYYYFKKGLIGDDQPLFDWANKAGSEVELKKFKKIYDERQNAPPISHYDQLGGM